MFRVFMLFYPSMSPNASFALISFFLQSLTKAPHNTPAIKITSPGSLEATFVVRSVAAAFGHGYHTHTHTTHGIVADRFLLPQQVAQQKSTCVIRVTHIHESYQ